VAPWSMFSIIVFGLVAGQFGFWVAVPIATVLSAIGTSVFPKSGVASTGIYRLIFIGIMFLCFLTIAILSSYLPKAQEEAVWLLTYFSAVALIELSGFLVGSRKEI